MRKGLAKRFNNFLDKCFRSHRTVLEEQLSADMSRLSDVDDFSKNLSFFWEFDSMADVEVVCALEEHFGISISDTEARNAYTVGDIISLVAAKREALNAI